MARVTELTVAADHEDDLVCARCGPHRDRSLAGLLAAAARCLAIDGRIDRAHVTAVHAAFGLVAEPITVPSLVAGALAARPELAGSALLVADPDAVLRPPADRWRAQLAIFEQLHAPEVVLSQTRAMLADAEASPVTLTWDRVHAWPAAAQFPGTIAFGAVARALAAHAIPPLVAHDALAILAAIDRASTGLVLDRDDLAYRNALAAESSVAGATADPRRARGLELAVRFLDELGHTDLRDNQDTLVDDCYFALETRGLTAAAASLYGVWLVAAEQAARAAS